MAEPIIIYTDGSSRGNPGPGGYGVVLMSGPHRKEMSEGFRLTTNNRMELLAVIKGLEALKNPGSEVIIYSDSKYVVDSVEKKWIYGWMKKGFNKVKNPDLWKRFLSIYQKHHVKFVWVKGHSSNPYNKLDGALMKLVQSMTIKDATRFHDVIDFEDIIHEALTKYEFYPGFSKIRATVVVNKNYELTSNRLIIQSIVQNLIENAIKYQNPHVESFLHIQVGGTDNEAVLVFEDNGIGIEKSIQEKVFEMYFRGTQKSNGSGLGLYLVKTGIDKLGGNISIMSEPGVGSTFIITLPTIQNEIAHR